MSSITGIQIKEGKKYRSFHQNIVVRILMLSRKKIQKFPEDYRPRNCMDRLKTRRKTVG
jgi:hypothetical protein